ncbi:hypothetical protein UO65_1073 [Actinokineospora spheciospongiae]|uniref:Uncharacterized protein n=1 Tax=Actinokineospora spheciospongiae TaxID=909613 RepID=W7JC82_9PSEU|nr:hypothetical protein UO65_1073 [Actinokineospora spheciospongiae]
MLQRDRVVLGGGVLRQDDQPLSYQRALPWSGRSTAPPVRGAGGPARYARTLFGSVRGVVRREFPEVSRESEPIAEIPQRGRTSS